MEIGAVECEHASLVAKQDSLGVTWGIVQVGIERTWGREGIEVDAFRLVALPEVESNP